MKFLTNLGLTKPLCSFRLVLEGKTSKGLTESSRLEFLETFSVNNFALSDAEDSNLGLLIFFFFFFHFNWDSLHARLNSS